MTLSLRFNLVRFGHQGKWLRATLQPAPVLCALMIVALWTVLSLVLMAERQRTVDSAIQ